MFVDILIAIGILFNIENIVVKSWLVYFVAVKNMGNVPTVVTNQ